MPKISFLCPTVLQSIRNRLIYIQARFACLRCAACRHCVSADLPSGCLGILGILEEQYVAFLFYAKYARLSFVHGYINEIRTVAEILFRDKYNLLSIKSTILNEAQFESSKFTLLKIIILK